MKQKTIRQKRYLKFSINLLYIRFDARNRVLIRGEKRSSLSEPVAKKPCTTNIDEDATTILDLNDDCLLDVFKYVPRLD